MTDDANMIDYLVFDIETAALGEFDQETTEYLMDKSFSSGMHPVFAKIIAIGYKLPGEKPIVLKGEDEKRILEQFWEILRRKIPGKFVTFSGYRFDLPFLNIRSRINGIFPSVEINTNKWRMWFSNHFDCMLALSHLGILLNVRLEIACRMLGIKVKDSAMRGADIPSLYKIGRWDEIEKHCVHDLELTEQLYLKLKV